MHTISSKKILFLRPDDITVASEETSKRLDSYELKRLADTICENGVIEPVSVRKGSKGEYTLITGRRRLEASKLAGLRRIPCIVHRADDLTADIYTVSENLQHKGLHYVQIALSLDRILRLYGITQTELGLKLGISQTYLSEKLQLLKLENGLLDRLEKSDISEKQARLLLGVPKDKREDILNRIIAEDMNYTQSLLLIEEAVNPKEETPLPVRKSSIGDPRFFANSLTKLISTMNDAGTDARLKRYENENFIEYRIKIAKIRPDKPEQLSVAGFM